MADDQDDDAQSKLTRSKIAWAREGKFLTDAPGDEASGHPRLPPGQHLTVKWPVLDLGIQPEISLANWRLRILGVAGGPVVLRWQDLLDLPQADMRSDIHCVTSWSRYDNDWRGVSTAALLAAYPPLPDRRHVVLRSADDYTTNLALADFAHPQALIAHGWSGDPITAEHGGPVRAVIPHLYLWKSAKWLTAIDYRVDDRPGFWETRGYHNHADPWTEERYS